MRPGSRSLHGDNRVDVGHFRAFTARAQGLSAAVITQVEVFPAFDPANPPPDLPKPLVIQALWDTGATGSLISPDAAARLGLTTVGSRNVNHAGGAGISPVYLVNVRLPNGVGVQGVEAVEFSSPSHFEFIVGMNIITQGDFAITNVGNRTCVSFRIPSCEEIDYVRVANRMLRSATGRNDPCPCGSGRKFKKCHGGPNPPP